MNIDIGSKIKTLRLSKSMTQEQLAKALHVSAQAVSKWENGSSLPDIQLLPALSVTLGTSIDSLFSLTDESRFARIDNMLWDKRFLTQQEFDEEEHFLQEKCREEETRPRATLLLAELYCKRAREYNDLASPLARQALALNLDCKEAHNAIFDAEHGAYLDWNATNHYRTIAFYQEFLAAHPENHSAHLWLLDLLIADRRCAEAREVLDKMHRLKPTYNDDFYLGCILLQEGHTDDALAQWEAMCAKYPDTWEVYVMRASELAKLAHYDEAIADYAAEKKEIAVSVDCPEDLTVFHDSKWTSEALFNLLDNAVKYTPAGGKIAVSVVLWEMYVEVKVTDTGKGISESNQAAIFRRFYREEEVHEQQGVGIGLYLAREIVTRQGGYIKVVSEPGKGSEFSIMLPTK